MNSPHSECKPNVVLILADDHGYGDASCYGGGDIRTPSIDRIAAAGARFTHFYANSPVCSPSRAALLTGRYPDMVGVPGVIRTHAERSWGYFDPAAVTLPDALKAAGYLTAHVGKWHLGLEPENHPCERGFDLFRGFLGDMMDDYYTHVRHGHNYMRDNRTTIDPPGHATDLFTSWAVEFLRDQADANTPFFLYLAYNAPHTPIQPPDDWYRAVRQREPQLDEKRARYIALVEHMDSGIGQVLDTIEARGMSENTLVIYASDNGGQLDAGACNGRLRGAKQDMSEGGIRVPCCAAWPGRIPAGKVTPQLAMLMDLFPTVCAAAGAPFDHEIDARSVLPTLLGEPQDFADRVLYWVRREGGGRPGHDYLGQDYHALRRGNMKLLHDDPFSPLELYDMASDERETTDISAKDPGVRQELARTMQSQVRKAGAVPWRKGE